MTISPERRENSTRQLLSLAYLWSLLRTPETFALALALLGGILSLAILIPQIDPALTSAADYRRWVSDLPGPYQPLAPLLDALGLFRILESPWFWLPAAWLALVCLIILADYTPHIWGRFWKRVPRATAPPPHPLSDHFRQTLRVPTPPSSARAAVSEAAMTHLRTNLLAAGFQPSPAVNQRQTVFMRRPGRWIAPILVVLGLLLLILAAAVQMVWGENQTVVAAVDGERFKLAGQVLQVDHFTPRIDRFHQITGGQITLSDPEGKSVAWQLFRPHRLGSWWVGVVGVRPRASIQLSQNRVPSKTVDFSFDGPLKTVRFSYGEADLLFAVRYLATADGPDFNIEVLKPPAGTRATPTVIKNGTNFAVPDFNITGQMVIEDAVRLRAYRVPALSLLLSGLLSACAGVVLLTLSPPSLVWLTLITRGRGSRISVDVETMRTFPGAKDHLTALLTLPSLEMLDD